MENEPSVLPLHRTRLALALVAFAAIALELALMRGLAIRFSSHFAGIVISVGLLGFGAAGSCLTLFRSFLMRFQRGTLVGLALALAVAVPVTWIGSQGVPLNINYLAWNPRGESLNILLLELYMILPFTFAGAFIGIVLMDTPRRINGHYASDLLGSGIGGVSAVLAMNLLPISQLLVVISGLALLGALLLLRWRSAAYIGAALAFTAALVALAWQIPAEPRPNPYKPLTVMRYFEGTKEVYTDQGPLGRIDVIEGPRLHSAPQLSLNYYDDLPPHMEMYIDADGPALIYDCKQTADWGFTDYRTAAAPFHLVNVPEKVCILDAGGGVEIGLSLFHKAKEITALQLNPQVSRAMNGPLAARGGSIYTAAGVHVVNAEPRGFLAATEDTFDVIQFPPVGGFGAAGSDATQESYLYTVESVRSMFKHLRRGGILAITRGINFPPRDELRAFDLAVETLKREGRDPAAHLAMLRNASFSSTILVFEQPITPAQGDALRAFCKKRSFDLCALPGLKEAEANVYNTVRPPDPYFRGTQALLAQDAARENFLAADLFYLKAPTDDQPYFFHMLRPGSYEALQKERGESAHAFLEVSYVMLLVALGQAVVLAALLILLPLTPGIKSLRRTRGKTVCLGYFLMLGIGFMLLEMGFLQKLTLYLAHPIYAASVAIASFLVFAGMGSQLSRSWKMPEQNVGTLAALTAAAIGIVYLFGLDAWLSLSQAWAMPARCVIAALTIAPLAFAMGHLFPLGLHRVAQTNGSLVPWSWAINGFASVVATGLTPLLAMSFGFSRVVLAAVACYALAALLFRLMPKPQGDAPVTPAP